MIAGWTPKPGADVVITMRGTVKRLAADGHVALVELDDSRSRWVEIPVGELPGLGVQWAPAEESAP